MRKIHAGLPSVVIAFYYLRFLDGFFVDFPSFPGAQLVELQVEEPQSCFSEFIRNLSQCSERRKADKETLLYLFVQCFVRKFVQRPQQGSEDLSATSFHSNFPLEVGLEHTEVMKELRVLLQQSDVVSNIAYEKTSNEGAASE